VAEATGWTEEFEGLLEQLSYEISTARAIGLARPDDLRDAVKRMRDIVADAEALVGAAGAESRKAADQ
jgi:hypothetical protein